MLYTLDGIAPEIDESAWVAPGARLMGRVRLEPGASVWFNAVLRGDNERIRIGPRCNVQDGCVLHTDPGFPLDLEEEVTLGHAAIVHGCTVRAGALIGMGATVLNGAEIGAGSLIGAGALVPEGKAIPPGVLAVGSPAKVVRELTDQQKQALRATALRYVENAKRYRNGLQPV